MFFSNEKCRVIYCLAMLATLLVLSACGSKSSPYKGGGSETINKPVGLNSIGIAGSVVQSGGLTQSEHFSLQAYITPFAGTVLVSPQHQITDITIQNRFTPGENE